MNRRSNDHGELRIALGPFDVELGPFDVEREAVLMTTTAVNVYRYRHAARTPYMDRELMSEETCP